jgi:hypothetical protein
MGRRPDRERSCLLLVGAGRFRSPLLPDIAAIDPGVEELRKILTNPRSGVFAGDREHCIYVRNPHTQREVFDSFFTAAAQADDVLLVYYGGHGVLDRDGHLHLAVEESDPQQPIGNSVEFEKLKHAIETSPARLRVLILDCCYSGQALGRQSSDADDDVETAVAQVIDDEIAEGMFVLTSSDRQTKSRFVPGERTTAFTGALLRALAARPDSEVLLRDLYPSVAAELRRRRMPPPQTTAGNSSGSLVVRQPGDNDQGPELVKPVVTRRRTVIAALGVAAAVTATGIGLATSAGPTPPPPLPSVPASSPTPVVETASPRSPAVANAVFADDFSGPALDKNRWKPPSQPDAFRQEDGHLDISTRPGEGIDYTKLEPIAVPGEFTDVRFRLTMPSYSQAGQGGASFVVNPTSARPHVLGFGPGADGGVAVVPLPCDRASCRLAVYEDFTYPDYANPRPIKPGETVDIEIVRKDGKLLYLADSVQIGASKEDPGSLTGFWFAASAGADESWDVLIDDLVIQ